MAYVWNTKDPFTQWIKLAWMCAFLKMIPRTSIRLMLRYYSLLSQLMFITPDFLHTFVSTPCLIINYTTEFGERKRFHSVLKEQQIPTLCNATPWITAHRQFFQLQCIIISQEVVITSFSASFVCTSLDIHKQTSKIVDEVKIHLKRTHK